MKYYSFYLKALCAIWMSIAFSVVAHAQFDSAGDDPARLKWYSTETPSYRIILKELILLQGFTAHGQKDSKYRNPSVRDSLRGRVTGEKLR